MNIFIRLDIPEGGLYPINTYVGYGNVYGENRKYIKNDSIYAVIKIPLRSSRMMVICFRVTHIVGDIFPIFSLRTHINPDCSLL